MTAVDFGSITLEELIADDELLTRVDRKYLLPRHALTPVLQALPPGTRVLEIGGERSFAYRSVYFDTGDLLSFHLAARARRRRFKLRSRTYVAAQDAYLELKTRGARATTVKERIPYPVEAADHLDAVGAAYAAEGLHGVGIAPECVDDLRAVLTTRYRRTTLRLPAGAGRATIDTRLIWEGEAGTMLALPDHVIVETKSPARASTLDRALWAQGHRPATLSKYATGLAAMRPDLPRNKWTRVLRDVFDTPAAIRTEEPTCPAAV